MSSGRKWLPNKKALAEYVKELVIEVYGTDKPRQIRKIEASLSDDDLLPVIKQLKAKIKTDAKFNMLFTQMFTNVPRRFEDEMIIDDPAEALRVINKILTSSPRYTKSHVGCPINAILTYPMGTPEGFAAFLDPEINVYIKNILSAWKMFLMSEDSREFLNQESPYGWFCPEALENSKIEYLDEDGNLQTQDFQDVFDIDASASYGGFASWDAYFTREIKANARPVSGANDPTIIVNACESAPYRLAYDVKATDEFYLKSQKYGIIFMLNNDPLAPQFVGGTVYQAFLDNLNYHRYHSPIDGTVVKTYLVEGGFYTECRAMGYDDQGDNRSQGYLTMTQTRVLIFIESDNPKIGLMCFIGVGMGDVSSCESFVYAGQKVKKGQQIGTFHIGGSTHCLCFRKGVNLEFYLRGQTPDLNSTIIPINSKIARVVDIVKK